MGKESGRSGPDRRDPLDRFWSKVNKSCQNGCWEWTASTVQGYGQFGAGGRGVRNVRAHRFSWQLSNGPIPPGMDICHRCDNPPCVNPDHLFVGTRRDNIQDMIAKSRDRLIGERSSNARLSDDAVRAIRYSFAAGVSRAVLAEQYGIKPESVNHIVNGKRRRSAGALHPVSAFGNRPRGERNNRAKITDAQVEELLIERSSGVTIRALAQKYGMSEAGVSSITRGRSRAKRSG